MERKNIDLRELLLDLRALSADDLVLLRVMLETDITVRADKRRPLVDLVGRLQPAANADCVDSNMTKT